MSKEKTEEKTQKSPEETKKRLLHVLKHKGAFQHMQEAMLEKLLTKTEIRKFKQGHMILQEGGESKFIFILLKGRLAVYVAEKFLYYLNRTGDVIGEIGFICNSKSTATVQAKEDINAFAISRNSLKELGGTNFYLWLCRVLADKLARTSKKIKE